MSEKAEREGAAGRDRSREAEGDLPLPLKDAPGAEYVDPVELRTSEWMTRAKQGDAGAFDQLTEALRGRAVRLAQAWVGSREDALELSQEAFLKTYRARDTYREGEPFLPWFHRILRNTCFSFLRKTRRLRERSVSAGTEPDEPDWEIADDGAPPQAGVDAQEASSAFWAAFRVLSARDREVLSLRHFQELSYRQIARQLEIPEGTVMSRLFHARRRLRIALGGYFDDVPGDERGDRAQRPGAAEGPREERG